MSGTVVWLLEFIGSVPCAVAESHDSAETETDRLRKVGFTDFTVISTTERGRPLIVARRS